MVKNGRGRKMAENQLNIRLRPKLMLLIDFSREKNMEIEYPHAIVIIIQRFQIFGKIFPRSKKVKKGRGQTDTFSMVLNFATFFGCSTHFKEMIPAFKP